MLTVIFYGDLRTRFGRRYTLAVHSPAEAIHALCVQLKGLRQYFQQHATSKFLVRNQQRDQFVTDYEAEELGYPQSTGVLKVVPLVEGAGAIGKVVLGVAFIAAGVFTGGTAWAALAPALISIGVGLAASGIAQMIAPRAKGAATPEKADNEPSLAFNGAVNTTGQGGPVPLGYGHLLVGSQIVSVGFSTNNEIVVR
ncbi:tail assembly protein [Paraburkholderia dipogonis]|uniref:tail assembly protein n=1 Tax=Paraburkholderia dipogonis TaxID=1211383 RepID=UPI0038B9FC91